MLKFIKNTMLQQKQNAIKKKYPGINITLHPEMPSPSMAKMLELSGIVAAINALEPQISSLSDEQLKIGPKSSRSASGKRRD